MLQKPVNFLRHDIWRIRIRELPKKKYYVFKPLRIFLLGLRGFHLDQCQLRASALTFYSLLSVVPVAAMAFGVAKGFGFEKNLDSLLRENLQGQEEVLKWIIQFANSFLENTKGGLIAGVGIVVLFGTVVKVLGNIESSFNYIWDVKRGRPLGRKLSDYLSIMLICPTLFITASSANVFVTTYIVMFAEKVSLPGSFSEVLFLSLKILPYCVVWTLFCFLYMFMPNTKVSFKAGIFAGVVAGTMYQVLQWAYIFFQIGVAKYNAIYGSFAALPFFLIWMQLSWLVVLLGAEISFAFDNEENYEFEADCKSVSTRSRILVALRIVELCARRFTDTEKAYCAREIANQMEAPIRFIKEILNDLVHAGVLSEVQGGPSGVAGYHPARSLENLTIKKILDLLEKKGSEDLPFLRDKKIRDIKERMDSLDQLVKESTLNSAITRL